MQLLISVRSVVEARSALDGGAEIVDAKEPDAGALGAVDLDVFRHVVAAVAGRVPVTAALGDAHDEAPAARAAAAFARAGAAFVKIGFAGVEAAGRVRHLTAAVASEATSHGSSVVAVAYADADLVGSLSALALIDVAARAGARGVLLDTARKDGPGVCDRMGESALAAWVRRAHDAGLLVAIAGSLTEDQLPRVRDLGADIAGVRGAACVGGRSGVVSSDRVRCLRERVADASYVSGAREASPPVPVSP